MSRRVILIDLSSIAYPLWHTQETSPEKGADYTARKTVEEVRRYAGQEAHVAVCCDSGRSFRAAKDETYKQNRKDKDARLVNQIRVAGETLAADGFPVWAVPSFEADDLIASATAWALALEPDATVLVVSGDKDLLQLVGPRVTVKSTITGVLMDADAVRAKFGVSPAQMCDWLCLVGDTADNIKGAKGIGEKTAMTLLGEYGTLAALYPQMDSTTLPLTPSVLRALADFRERWPAVRELVTLRADVALPFDQLVAPRVPTTPDPVFDFEGTTMPDQDELPPAIPTTEPAIVAELSADQVSKAVARQEVLPAPSVEWERQLDPRSPAEAWKMANIAIRSRMFSAYGTPEQVYMTIAAGRALGLDMMTSLRCIHVIEGKQSFSAQLVVGLVRKSKLAKSFRMTELTDERCTFETERSDEPGVVSVTHTIQMAEKAGLVKPGSGWVKNPQDMLMNRTSLRLARAVYQDIVANVYDPDELIDGAINV